MGIANPGLALDYENYQNTQRKTHYQRALPIYSPPQLCRGRWRNLYRSIDLWAMGVGATGVTYSRHPHSSPDKKGKLGMAGTLKTPWFVD